MATSGTVDTTVVSTDVVLAHAMRRCGVAATAQTPEIVELAQECLFFLILSLASRGVNLWCVEKNILDVVVGKKTYVLPPGTLSVLNATFSNATYVTGTNSSLITAGAYYQVLLSTSTSVVRVGVTYSVLPTTDVFFQYSDDGATWTTSATVKVGNLPAVNTRGWFDLNIVGNHTYYRAYAGVAGVFTATELLLCATISDLPISRMNRDDYTSLPDKNSPGSPAVQQFFEKLVDPQITLWPVPNVAGNQFCVWRHRQIQDVGSLTQQLELPNRWFESIIWHLALRLCFELPPGSVDPARLAQVSTVCQGMQIEVESGENDDAPTFYSPSIGVYTI